MATAYAAFTSLMHLTTQLHKHPYPPIQLDEKQFDSLNSNICFFQRFLEDHHSTIDHESEIRIVNAAHDAEELIETHIADRVPDFYGSLQIVIECIDLIKKEVMAEMNQSEQSQQVNNPPARYPTPHVSTQSPSAAFGENFVVGIEYITINIVDKLTSSQHKSDRQIISVSGMEGIGKTTLARKVYEHPCIKDYFHILAWTTISKDYNTHASLLEILHCLIDRSESKESSSEKSEYELGERIYKCLFGRRYLVILDDIWDLEAWERMGSFFLACRGSKIVATSRESKFASISSHSWDLFRKHAFGQDSCPDELESVGKKIARKCRGLPLSIAVIGSHLAKSPRNPEYWEYISDDISSVDDDHCLEIVSLSYTHLPVHLKPCFLYFAIFPEDKEIDVSRLIRLWVAEGLVKPINGKSLENAARDYLNDLVDRGLILASRASRRGRTKRSKIHDLLRDFCLKEASKKDYICTVQKLDDLKVTNDERRIVVHPSALKEASTVDLLSEKQELSNNNKMQNEKIGGQKELIVNHQLDINFVLKAREFLVERIPNIKKLCVCYDDDYEGFEEGVRTLNNVDRLQMLESFVCTEYKPLHTTECIFQNLTLPRSLKRLTVEKLHWDDVTTKIGSLPLLEVLQLRWCAGREWKLIEGRFIKLKDLELSRCRSLRYLTANNNHFPCLQRLLLNELDSLEGISSEIGDITALESIELRSCQNSAVMSAKEIADEHYDLGNQHLQVTAMFFESHRLPCDFLSGI